MAKWRSDNLAWIAMGSVLALLALWRVNNPADSERQNLYASRADCERDYDPSQCRSHTTAGYYYGPRYGTGATGDPGPGRTSENGRSQVADSVHTHSSRSGFGSTGRGYGGGYG